MFAIHTQALVRDRVSRSGTPNMHQESSILLMIVPASEFDFVFRSTATAMEGYATVCASSHVAAGTPLLPDLAAVATFQRRC